MRVRRPLASVLVLFLGLQLLVAGVAVAAETHEADFIDFEFVPPEMFIEEGDTVRWTNHDPELHTATWVEDPSFSVGVSPNGGTGELTFDEEGVYELFCKLHPEMTATVYAGVDPFEPEFPEPTRLTATDAIGTAIEWSKHRYPDEFDVAFALLGRDDVFADSLASGGAQGQIDAPLLLTGQSSLAARTRAELDRLGVRTVYVLGGPAAIADSVLAELRAAGFGVRRVFGPDRVATAVAVAERFYPGARTAIVARGFAGDDATQAFADSLAAGALAARMGVPIILTATDALSPDARRYFETQAIDEIIIAGGTAAVSAQVQQELEAMDITVTRAGGATRVETAVALFHVDEGSDFSFGVSYVDGTNPLAWADGFAAAGTGNPVLLTAGPDVPAATVTQQLIFGFFARVCGTTVATGACDRIDIAATAFPGALVVVGVLAADDEASEGGSVIVELLPTDDPATLCWNWFAQNMEGQSTDAVLREGDDGEVLIDMGGGVSAPWDPNDVYGCTFDMDPDVVSAILEDPRDHTATVGNDEVSFSGSLFTPSGALIGFMIGESVVPEPGDFEGSGFAFMLGTDDPDELCAYVGHFDLSSPPSGMHIHEGAEGEVGDVVLELPVPDGEELAFCLTDEVVPDLFDGETEHYIQIHTEDFPDGAVRGQLFNLFGAEPEAEEAQAEAAARGFTAFGLGALDE
jgi:putative cell wall-binding protein